MKRAFVFPGQGSQQPGMGRDLAEAFAPARLLFEEVDDALSQHLSRLMFEGPEGDLTLTENAQPALLAASLAVIRVLEAEAGFDVASLAYVAGHSLGEYSAHAAAGTFPVPDAVRLVKRRGQAMQKAVPVGEGGDGGAARASTSRPLARLPPAPRATGSASSPTTIARDRSSSAAIARQSSMLSRWPPNAAPGGRSCCR